MLPIVVPQLRAEQELVLSDEVARLLCRMIAATVDRNPAGERGKLVLRGDGPLSNQARC
jgi:hypothetical protein